MPSTICSTELARRAFAGALALCAALVAPAFAHDFWIRPARFSTEPNQRVAIDLRVGEHFHGEAVARNPDKIARFCALHAQLPELSIPGIEGRAPAGYFGAPSAGLWTLGYRSRPSSIELAAEKFESYLAAEGLEHVSALRKQRGASGRPGKELYSRCAKSLVCVGAPRAENASELARALGFPLELFAHADPYRLHAGDELELLLVFNGAPLANALVGCVREGAPEREQRLRSDARGCVRFVLEQAGVHLVHAVHMLPAPPESGADWESLWAALTFELPASQRASEPRRE